MTPIANKLHKILCGKHHPSKTTLVFIHGNSTDSSIWNIQLQDSRFFEYTLLALDLPGHGKSPRLPNYSVPKIVEILVENIKPYENVVLVGHSLGGHLAIEMLPFLNNCKGIVLCGASPVKSPPNMSEAFLPDKRMGLLFQKELNASEVKEFAGFVCVRHDRSEYDFTAHIHDTDPTFRQGIGMSLANGELADEAKILSETGIPVAIFNGESDTLVNIEYVKNLSIPNLWRNKIQLIPESSHSPQLELAETFNRLLFEFLKDIA